MPDDLTGFGGPQTLQAAQPPQYILDVLGGSYDPMRYSWNPDTMSLVDNFTGGSYGYGHIADPALGTHVVLPYGRTGEQVEGNGQNLGNTLQNFGDTLFFEQGQNPFFGFGDGQTPFISSDPQQIDQWQHNQDTRARQEITKIAALVAGGAAAGALGSGAASAGEAAANLGGSLGVGGAGGATAAGAGGGLGSLGGLGGALGGAILDSSGSVIPGTDIGAGAAGPSLPSSPGGILDSSGVTIPGTEGAGSLFSERLRNALGSFGDVFGGSMPQGGAPGYGTGGNPELMSMMQALLQRQRIPTPQGPMGARYKPYG